MGIPEFWKNLKQEFECRISTTDKRCFGGSNVAIDMGIYLYYHPQNSPWQNAQYLNQWLPRDWNLSFYIDNHQPLKCKSRVSKQRQRTRQRELEKLFEAELTLRGKHVSEVQMCEESIEQYCSKLLLVRYRFMTDREYRIQLAKETIRELDILRGSSSRLIETSEEAEMVIARNRAEFDVVVTTDSDYYFLSILTCDPPWVITVYQGHINASDDPITNDMITQIYVTQEMKVYAFLYILSVGCDFTYGIQYLIIRGEILENVHKGMYNGLVRRDSQSRNWIIDRGILTGILILYYLLAKRTIPKRKDESDTNIHALLGFYDTYINIGALDGFGEFGKIHLLDTINDLLAHVG